MGAHVRKFVQDVQFFFYTGECVPAAKLSSGQGPPGQGPAVTARGPSEIRAAGPGKRPGQRPHKKIKRQKQAESGVTPHHLHPSLSSVWPGVIQKCGPYRRCTPDKGYPHPFGGLAWAKIPNLTNMGVIVHVNLGDKMVGGGFEWQA